MHKDPCDLWYLKQIQNYVLHENQDEKKETLSCFFVSLDSKRANENVSGINFWSSKKAPNRSVERKK